MKNKFTILFILLSVTFVVTSQKSKKISIEWEDVQINTSYNTITVPGFDESHFNYSDVNGVTYSSKWNEYSDINESSAKIIDIEYKRIYKHELKNLNPSLIPNKLKYQIKTITARNKKEGYLEISPIIKDGDTYKKIISFTIQYHTGGSSFRLKKSIVNKSFTETNSVLANGEWYKFYIEEKTGIYKITPEFLEKLGMNLSGVNPQTIKIYGNGGQMMPLLNENNTEFDLRENSIQVIGGEDGVFSGNDYILFYGEGVAGYSEENNTNLNLYSDKSYYFITTGGANGNQVSNYVEPNGAATTQIDSFTDYQFREKNEVNISMLGRRWFWDQFNIESTKSYEFDFTNLITTKPIEIKVYAGTKLGIGTNMNISVNNLDIGTLTFPQKPNSHSASHDDLIKKDLISNTDKITVKFTYNNNGNPSATGYLDYISLKAHRALRSTEKQIIFTYEEAATLVGIGQYNITNANSVSQVWDVTRPERITSIPNSNSQTTIQFKANLGESRKYLMVVPGDYYTPKSDEKGKVKNQNIKGTIFKTNQGQFQDIDYLIITNNNLLQSANKLAEHHIKTNNYVVKILTLEDIYNEFGSGKQDVVAIRNAVRYIYENASEPSKKLKYLCLLGDASIDYKNSIPNNNNIVPTFESLESFSFLDSFPSDDFYGLMDLKEGEMDKNASDQLDIAVGRIIADTPQLASNMVSKIINYDTQESYGRWRNAVMLIADDVDADWEERIQRELNVLGDSLVKRNPFINLNKIYADAYQQESSASGNRYPKVNEAIVGGIEKGAIVVDYFGHGGEDGLGHEFIYNISDAKRLENENRYPIIVTVTCEFTRFDNPLRPSAGEYTYWNAKGGAVGLISTTREVTLGVGVNFNKKLFEILFPAGNDYLTVGEAIRQTKNSLSNTASRRVIFFFGDPAMKLAIPKPDIKLTKINGKPITQPIDVLKALSRIKVSGEVVDPSGNLLDKYKGVLLTTIYDKEIKRTTLGNDGTVGTGGLIKLEFNTLGEIVFKGRASVTNGLFDFEFIVPKDIVISEGNGRISFYASKTGELEDQTGVNETIRIGGLNENAPQDNTGPEIQLFLNDENFVSGGVVDSSPILIAKLQDINGINTASGIGHDITAILDGDEMNPIILNDYYETEIDDFTKGVVNYKMKNLKAGLHTLVFKGWDVYNNSSTQEIQFTVIDDSELRLKNVLNYPNPFVSQTEFWFEHNSSASDVLEVQVQVFTVSGKVVWTSNKTLSGKTEYKEDIQWNGKDDFGDKLGKGVYVYKISVKSTLLSQRVEKFEKLVIL